MLHTKYQSYTHPVLKKKSFKVSFFIPMFELDTTWTGPVLTPGAYMNKLGRRPIGDATYQISKLYAFQYQRRRMFKSSFFVPMFQFVTPVTGPLLTTGASYGQILYRSLRKLYIPNIKTLPLPVSEKKNFEVFLFCSYVPKF